MSTLSSAVKSCLYGDSLGKSLLMVSGLLLVAPPRRSRQAQALDQLLQGCLGIPGQEQQ
jgi:hypothetical protein